MTMLKLGSLKLACLVILCVPFTSMGQTPGARLNIDDLQKLEANASQITNVTLDAPMIQLLSRSLIGKTPEEAKLGALILGLKGIYVKIYEFDDRYTYSPRDLDSIRAQLGAPGWSKLVGIRSTRDQANVDVYVMSDAARINGITVINSEPDGLTLVNVVGPLDPDNLTTLEGHFGIPQLGLVAGGQKPPARTPETRKRTVTRP